jgi:hypothetical protein
MSGGGEGGRRSRTLLKGGCSGLITGVGGEG